MEPATLKVNRARQRRAQQKANNKKRIYIKAGVTGVVDRFFPRAGYGIIIRDDNMKEITVLSCDILRNCPFRPIPSLGEGELVEFDVVTQNKKLKAVNVTGPNGTEVRGSQFVKYVLVDEIGKLNSEAIRQWRESNGRIYTKKPQQIKDMCSDSESEESNEEAKTHQNDDLVEKETFAALSMRGKNRGDPSGMEKVAEEDKLQDYPMQTVLEGTGNEKLWSCFHEVPEEHFLGAAANYTCQEIATEEQTISKLLKQPLESEVNLDLIESSLNHIDINGEVTCTLEIEAEQNVTLKQGVQTNCSVRRKLNRKMKSRIFSAFGLRVKEIGGFIRKKFNILKFKLYFKAHVKDC